MPHPYVDKDECIGCESCVQICPDVFHMDDDSKAEADPEADDSKECIQDAMDTCPVECIHWRD